MSSLDRLIRLFRYLKPYRVRLGAAFLCSGLVAAFSGAYAWLVKPVLDEIFINKNESLLLVLPVALFLVAVLKSVFNYGQNYLMNYVGNRVITDIRQELFGKLIRLPVPYHDVNTSGRLVSRVVNDVTLMANAVAGVLKDIFQQGLTFLAAGRSLGDCHSLGRVHDGEDGETVAGAGGKRPGADGGYGLHTSGNVIRHSHGEGLWTRRGRGGAISTEQPLVPQYDDEGDSGLLPRVVAYGSDRCRGGRSDYLVRRLPRDQRLDDAGGVFLISDSDVHGLFADSPAFRFQ